MASLRDTSADEAAALQTSGPRPPLPAEDDPPVTLTGRKARRLADALRRTFKRLQDMEADKRIPWRVRDGIRADRITVSAALAHIENEQNSAREGGPSAR
jgi:hypothetical protein